MPDSTNLLGNGGLEVNATGWLVAQSTITRTTEQASKGSYSGKIQATVNGGLNHISTPWVALAHPAGQDFVASIDVLGEGAVVGRSYNVRLFTTGGANGSAIVGAPVPFVMPAGWTRIVVTGQLDFADRTLLRLDTFRWTGTVVDIGDTYYVDAAQIETGTVPTDYIDTNNGVALTRRAAEAALAASAGLVADAGASRLRGNALLAASASLAANAITRTDIRHQALEYRRQQQAREDHRLQRELALAGSAAAVTRQEANWDALRPWDGWNPIRRVKGEPE